MSRRLIPVLLGALALMPVARALASTATSQASTSESDSPIDDQGSSFHYRSEITSIVPRVQGLSIEVLEFADRLVIRNHTGKTVTIYGYSGEPYARVRPDGATEQNVRSPSVYLNTSFYGNVTVPASANAKLPPKWVMVDRAGSFEWHDHRVHWMSPATPPEVKDKGKRTKIFDWSVPISVGAQRGVLDGRLLWVPESSKAPIAAIFALIAIVLLALGFVAWVRRRRARLGGSGTSGDDPAERPGEAW
jgi:hypothetical protein